jgi:hypothetical protein
MRERDGPWPRVGLRRRHADGDYYHDRAHALQRDAPSRCDRDGRC